jgi:hypothetical protein
MTKIAIYGDSFASTLEGWPNYLKSLYKNSRVDVFGVGGSSANFSYMRFLETHKKYDIVIFLWTFITRNALIVRDFDNKKYYVRGFTETDFPSNALTPKDSEDIKPYVQGFTGTDVAFDELKETIRENLRQNLRFNNMQIQNRDLPEFVKIDNDWVLHESIYSTKHPSKNFLHNLAMRDSVKLQRPDSINIEISCYTPEISMFGMCNIPVTDLSQLLKEKTDPIKYREDWRKKPNHLTDQQSKEFAVYMYKQINQKDFDIHKTFVKPEKYYTMSKTLEEGGFIV